MQPQPGWIVIHTLADKPNLLLGPVDRDTEMEVMGILAEGDFAYECHTWCSTYEEACEEMRLKRAFVRCGV